MQLGLEPGRLQFFEATEPIRIAMLKAANRYCIVKKKKKAGADHCYSQLEGAGTSSFPLLRAR